MKYIAIDFEYNESSEPHMGLMAVSYTDEQSQAHSNWLYRDKTEQGILKQLLELKKETHIFLSFNVVAEASCFLALGLDPRDFKWIDLYLEYKQAANHNNDFKFGKHVVKDAFGTQIRESKPLFKRSELEWLDDLSFEDRERVYQIRKNQAKDTTILNHTLENALLNVVPEAYYNPDTKRDARRLILDKKPSYSPEEIEQILDYAKDDVEYLVPMLEKFRANIQARTGWNDKTIEQAMLWRGRYGANVAKYTMQGIPLNMDRLANLEHNAEGVLNQAKESFNKECYPIYVYKKDPKKGWVMGQSTLKTNTMVQLLVDQFDIEWRLTKDGNRSMSTEDGEPLQQYVDIHPWLKKLVRIKNLQSILKGYKEPDLSKHLLDRDNVFRDYVGSDGRVRPWYGPFGTQTGRNAPGAKAFVFAQSAVMRALIEPPKGRIIMEIDYGSQEAFIAPILSGDSELLRAYTSGDPYLAFAIATGAAPAGATKHSHKDIRTLYKSTVLGLQYGMGAKKLAIKLKADTGRAVSTEEAKDLIREHRKVYPRYYEWKDELWQRYREDKKPLILRDGWYLDVDQEVRLSVLNFPVQGTGSSMMRLCIDKLYDKGIDLLCPIHDSMVVECDEALAESVTEIVTQCMIEASDEIMGAKGMRVGEPELCVRGELWETEKNAYDLPVFAKYFESKLELDDNAEFLEEICNYF